MDSSGKRAFGIDLKTLWYVHETFTDEENECFNNFDKGREDDSTTINHREHVVLDWMMTGPGVLHPGKIIDHAVDNVAAEGMTNSERYRSAKDEQIGASIGMAELLLQQSATSSRVPSVGNFTDYFTRDKLEMDAEKILEYLEKKTGRKPRRWRLLPGKRDLGWMKLGPDESQQVWYENLLEWFDWVLKEHPETLRQYCRVDPGRVREAIVEGLAGAPIPEFPKFERNFPEKFGPSAARRELTSFPRPTRMQLGKELVRVLAAKNPERELASFMAKVDMTP